MLRMHADFSVELAHDDPALELPWTSLERHGPRYLDLRAQPELLLEVAEAVRVPELGEFLSAVNSAASRFQSAKCDAWFTKELSEEEEVFGAACKFACYVDLIFHQRAPRFALDRHQEFSQELVALLHRAPEISAAAELILRRCFFHLPPGTAEMSEPGFCITLYVFGYGDDEQDARKRWSIGLKLAENAILQLSARSAAC
jgi:hypothetical protein